MQFSICSDYSASNGNIEAQLKRIANAGFDGIQWLQHWYTDFIYTGPEIKQIQKWLNTYGLKFFDIHGTDGKEKKWYSETEYQRQAGVEIVKNRMLMTHELGGKTVIMHIPRFIAEHRKKWAQLRKSLDELEKVSAKYRVRIAVENCFYDDFKGISELMRNYSPSYLGICYDSGHGHMGGLGLPLITALKTRLIAIHLHDNNGYDDQHKPPFTGTLDWEPLTAMIAASTYKGPLMLETIMSNSGVINEDKFLSNVYAAGRKLASMIEKNRKKIKS